MTKVIITAERRMLMLAGVSTACMYPQLLEDALYDPTLPLEHNKTFKKNLKIAVKSAIIY